MRLWTPTTLVLTGLLLVVGLFTARVETGQVPPATSDLVAVAPADNPTTPAKIALGRMLFWDPILSGGRDVACATCHHPDLGYSDGLPLSIGVNGIGLGSGRRFAATKAPLFAKRNSQTVLNAAFIGLDPVTAIQNPAAAPMFWDNRARGLEAQALGPIKSAEEMRGDAYSEAAAVDTVVARLRATPEYGRLFSAAFGGDGITAVNLARALAAFERSLVAMDAPFDRYRRGESNAMTALQIEGMAAFERIGCIRCHSGVMFSDFKLHVLPVPQAAGTVVPDTGAEGTYAFRTPSLRNLRFTAPYMHTGAFQTVDAALRVYNRGGGGGGRGGRRGGNLQRAQLDPLFLELRRAGRNRQEIVAFLDALNDDSFDRTVPTRVPSGLPPGGNIQP